MSSSSIQWRHASYSYERKTSCPLDTQQYAVVQPEPSLPRRLRLSTSRRPGSCSARGQAGSSIASAESANFNCVQTTGTITEAYSPNFIKTMSRITSEEGPSALFKGIAPRVMWISIGGAIFLGVYERARQTLVTNGVLA